MADYVKMDKDLTAIPKENVVIILCSTTGQGDPPDNARPFVRQLRKLSAPAFASLRIAVLGLGDTNYDKFCNAAKVIEKLFIDLGASRFMKSAFADEGTGYGSPRRVHPSPDSRLLCAYCV